MKTNNEVNQPDLQADLLAVREAIKAAEWLLNGLRGKEADWFLSCRPVNSAPSE